MITMKCIILVFAMTVLSVDAQNMMDQYGFGRYDSSVEFKSPKHGAHVKARKFGSQSHTGNMPMNNNQNHGFNPIPEDQPSEENDFFKNFKTPAGMPNVGGPKGLSKFFNHLGAAHAGSTNNGFGQAPAGIAGNGVVFGEGYGGSSGPAAGAGRGHGKGMVRNGDVFGQGEGFGIGFGQNGAEGYGRGPDMTSAMGEFQKWFS